MNVGLELTFIARLVVAGLLGAAIGLEREFRAKEAGLRTHFLVTLGSALIMIVSQWGFQSAQDIPGTRPADVARVAAQIVSGIGFLGAGAIIMQQQSVRGLTTAAGLWVAAGIGMAIGGGLYVVGSVGTLLTLVGLEAFQYLRNMKMRAVSMVLRVKDNSHLVRVTNLLNEHGYKVVHSVITDEEDEAEEFLRVKLYARTHPSNPESDLVELFHKLDGVTLERLG